MNVDKYGKKDMDDDYKKGNKTDDFSSVLLLSDNAAPATSHKRRRKQIPCMSTPPSTNYWFIGTWHCAHSFFVLFMCKYIVDN